MIITHVTTNTNDTQTFDVTPEGYDPAVIAEIRERIWAHDPDESLIDFGLLGLIVTAEREFDVISGGMTISHNAVSGDVEHVVLTTTLDRAAACEEPGARGCVFCLPGPRAENSQDSMLLHAPLG